MQYFTFLGPTVSAMRESVSDISRHYRHKQYNITINCVLDIAMAVAKRLLKIRTHERREEKKKVLKLFSAIPQQSLCFHG